MDDHKFDRAPDFTTACIVMFGVNLSWILFLLFAIYGVVIAVFAALVVNHLIKWIEQRKPETMPVTSQMEH